MICVEQKCAVIVDSQTRPDELASARFHLHVRPVSRQRFRHCSRNSLSHEANPIQPRRESLEHADKHVHSGNVTPRTRRLARSLCHVIRSAHIDGVVHIDADSDYEPGTRAIGGLDENTTDFSTIQIYVVRPFEAPIRSP